MGETSEPEEEIGEPAAKHQRLQSDHRGGPLKHSVGHGVPNINCDLEMFRAVIAIVGGLRIKALATATGCISDVSWKRATSDGSANKGPSYCRRVYCKFLVK